MDPLSDVLRLLRLDGAYFYLVEAAAPRAIATAGARDLVPRILPAAEHLVSYHVLVAGSCWGGRENEPLVQMRPGDVLLFPHGDAHVMASDEAFAPGAERATASSRRYPETVFLGSSEPDTMLLCGFLGCDAGVFNPLLTSLPRRLHLPGVVEGWMAMFPRQAIAEARAGRAGSETALTRMAELMFIEVVRRYVESVPLPHSGWLAGLQDAVVGPALARIHERPAHAWTLTDLARAVGSSRSVLAERFARIVGMTPMLYLTQWRLQLAADQLAHGSDKVATVAARVGYDSEAAFSRAFKRGTGTSPATWRRARHSSRAEI